jgi:hypothetical protein
MVMVSNEPGKIQEQMKLAALIAGMRISFRKASKERNGHKKADQYVSEYTLEIDDISRLKKAFDKKVNRF